MRSASSYLSLLSSILAISSPISIFSSEIVKITSPLTIVSQFNYGGVRGAMYDTPALFGVPAYQSTIQGRVYYSSPYTGCTAIDWHSMRMSNPPTKNDIVFIDRGGNCNFVNKVRNAEYAGFGAVIMGDNIPEYSLPYMADDLTTPPVQIPSVLIGYNDAQILRGALLAAMEISASITWSLPAPDDRVEWDLWTTSVDPLSVGLKHTIGQSVELLGDSALFIPHMFTINGAAIGCTAPSQPCIQECTNGGRYCAADPERNNSYGLSGRDVVQENLRQLCLIQALNQTGAGYPQYYWFRYVTLFDRNCPLACPSSQPNCPTGFSEACSYAQMHALQIDAVIPRVQQCVTASGGSGPNDGPNSILDAQITQFNRGQILVLPWLLINNHPYRGSLSCSTPSTVNNCGVFAAICGGFPPNLLPAACQPSTCPGTEFRDICGVCGGDGTSCATNGMIQFKQSTATVEEPNYSVTLSLTRTKSSYDYANVSISTQPITALQDIDYVGLNGLLISWGPGDTSDKTVDVRMIQDSEAEGDEYFLVSISDISPGAIIGTPNYVNVTIVANSPSVSVDDNSIAITVRVIQSYSTIKPETQSRADFIKQFITDVSAVLKIPRDRIGGVIISNTNDNLDHYVFVSFQILSSADVKGPVPKALGATFVTYVNDVGSPLYFRPITRLIDSSYPPVVTQHSSGGGGDNTATIVIVVLVIIILLLIGVGVVVYLKRTAIMQWFSYKLFQGGKFTSLNKDTRDPSLNADEDERTSS